MKELTFNFPVTRFVTKNHLADQLCHVKRETEEAIEAYDKELGLPEICIELLDVIHSAETALRIAERMNQNIDLDDLRDHVIAKNRSRGYYPAKGDPMQVPDVNDWHGQVVAIQEIIKCPAEVKQGKYAHYPYTVKAVADYVLAMNALYARTEKAPGLPAIGAPFEGGFFGGDITICGERYALVVAPKAEGEKQELEYKLEDRITTDGTLSDDDGQANTDRINNPNHPAANFCRSLRIAGHDDWYLPSRDELARLWCNLGPNRANAPELFVKGAAEAFEEDWYWSSTEYAPSPGTAWVVFFYNGYQYYDNKHHYCGVRAVRRIKLTL